MRVLGIAMCGIALAACSGDDGSKPPDLPAWHPELPASSVMGDRRGLETARGIIHLHSPYSHDACDGDPRPGPGGAIDEACLADLRAALCTTRQDFAALTDHDDTMADEPFENLFLMRGADQPIFASGGGQIGARLHCDDGHQVLISVGGENPIMPLMLDRHVTAADLPARHAIYNGDDPATVAAFRDAGGLVWIPHTEQRTTQEILDLDPDGIEVYQLHANIDPKIRPMYLGLSASGAIQAVADFADTNPGHPEPDLAFLSFVLPNEPSIARWNEVLAAGRHLAGSGGTDAHENALPILLADGERGDSYRRMMRWFANIALVADRSDPAQIEAALDAGRMFVAFEIMGTPVGFDVHAEAGAAVTELGGTVPVGAGATLQVTVPTIYELPADLPAPEIRARVLRVDGGGATEVAAGAGPTLSVPLDRTGAYRVEVYITPHQWGPYLGNLGPGYADTEHPWIYASPIYVTK